MDKLTGLVPMAVEHTKRKVMEDIERQVGAKEEMPAFEEYIVVRKDFIEQIWTNVWVNKASNDVPKNEKKAFLKELGYEVEGVDRKLVNKLFRTEIKNYHSFDVIQWLKEMYSLNEEKWVELFYKARKSYIEKEEERILKEKRRAIQATMEEMIEKVLEENDALFYLYVRRQTGKQLVHHLQNNKKYRYIETYRRVGKLIEDGMFHQPDYQKVSEFFGEFTGDVQQTIDWGRVYYDYETYEDLYERLISQYLFDFVPNYILTTSQTIKDFYEKEAGEKLTSKVLMKIMGELLYEQTEGFFTSIQDEYIADLLTVAEIPFNYDVHSEIYEQQMAEWERRKVEELAEIERKKAEEARIIEDVFGREYSLSFERPIQYILHIGETNTGKTHHALEKMKAANSGLYLAPLRLLALEVYDRLNSDGIPCSLKTGEEEKMISGANHIACTVEMFHEKDFYDVVVIDEAQMIADRERGFSWYKAIAKANANEVHIIGSRNIQNMLVQLLGESQIEIHDYKRDIPLEVESKEFHLNDTKKGDALICFSRKRVLETASKLQAKKHRVSMIYGSMPPETRKKQMQRFINGETNVVVSTDAIGMGLNLPIRRIVFLETDKFDGTKRRRLTSQEVKQIAGRAGRKGLYNVGKVAFSQDIKIMRSLLQQEDEPVTTFTIAPTSTVFEKFQRYEHNLGRFFELWEKFDNPKGTVKAALFQEMELYEWVKDTEIEARLSMMDLYGFLHLPFSTKDFGLSKQWLEAMKAIVEGEELPEPQIRKKTLDDLELSYKAIGLHLLFLYRLGKQTEAHYWERLREEISNDANDYLKSEVQNYKNKCKKCGRNLPLDFQFPICNSCHDARYKGRRYGS